MKASRLALDVNVLPQPDDISCGPTCLHAVYNYWNDPMPLQEVIAGIPSLPGGGSLAVSLACHALRRGYDAEITTYALQVFDPSWFVEGVDISDKLRRQIEFKSSPKLKLATESYLEFLELGGKVRHEELSSKLLRRLLNSGAPILTGLSATYLYGCAREYEDDYDDLRGEPTGHFVIITGFDKDTKTLSVVDPLGDNPAFDGHHYDVTMARLIGAIFLGIMTYDANLLVIRPKESEGTP